jgi:hypothetical protein
MKFKLPDQRGNLAAPEPVKANGIKPDDAGL